MEKPTTVSLNMAMTIDGRVSLPGGGWYGLSSTNDRNRMDLIRSCHDILLVGCRTVEEDDPVLWARGEDGEPVEDSAIPVILCRKSLPSLQRRIMRNPPVPTILIVERELLNDLPDDIEQEGVHYNKELMNDFIFNSRGLLAIGADLTDFEPANLMRVLSNLPGEGRILIEGGPSLNDAFLRADLVDTIYLTIVPHVMGGGGICGLTAGDNPIAEFSSRAWSVENSEVVADEIFLTYRRERTEREQN